MDAAGNESPHSAPVSAAPLPDTAAPNIRTVSPGSGTVGANPSIWITAEDNVRLQSISLAYRPASGGDWVDIGTQTRTGRYDGASFTWSTSGLAGGDYQLRAIAVDSVGLSSPESVFTLTLDLTPPDAPVLTVTPGGWSIGLSWTASSAGDLYGYRLLRQRADGGEAGHLGDPWR